MFENGITKLTLSASAMEDLKETMGKRKFERIFPLLLNDEPLHTNLDLSYEQNLHFSIDKELRHAYRGGWTYLKKDMKEKSLKMSWFTMSILFILMSCQNIYFHSESQLSSLFIAISRGIPCISSPLSVNLVKRRKAADDTD